MTLKEYEYHIGTNSQLNINKVVIYTMAKIAKKYYKKKVWKRT
jgi:hypothetical protein